MLFRLCRMRRLRLYPIHTGLRSHHAHAAHPDLKKLSDRGENGVKILKIDQYRPRIACATLVLRCRHDHPVSDTLLPRLYHVSTAIIPDRVPLLLRCHHDVHDPTTLVDRLKRRLHDVATLLPTTPRSLHDH